MILLLVSISWEVYVIVLTIALISLMPSYWIASSLIKRKRIAVMASVIGSMIIAPFIYVAIVGIALYSIFSYPSKTFTTEAWKATGWQKIHGDNVPPTRFEFSEDLIERKILIGKTKDEVLEMLGEGFEAGDTISYDLGFVPGHGIDPDFLTVYFENGVVVNVTQRRS